MMKLKITTDKTFWMDGITAITKLENLNGKQIDYQYSDPAEENPEFNYFEVVINGSTKVLAVAGKVEQWEIPDTSNKIEEWNKPDKGGLSIVKDMPGEGSLSLK